MGFLEIIGKSLKLIITIGFDTGAYTLFKVINVYAAAQKVDGISGVVLISAYHISSVNFKAQRTHRKGYEYNNDYADADK